MIALVSFLLVHALSSMADKAETISIEDLIRIRCSTDPKVESYTVFNGTVFSWVEGEEQLHLFGFVGYGSEDI